MTATADLVRDALAALAPRDGFHKPSPEQTAEATARAQVAIAAALDDVAKAARASNEPVVDGQTEWPERVTARFLTRTGRFLRNLSATVDVCDDRPHDAARSTAICRSCGWTKDHGLRYRADVLTWAQDHADDCTALPNPNA
jgi:hypothetical protein